MTLVNIKSGKEIKIGAKVTTFRGQKGKLVSTEQPRHEGSTGRVYVQIGNDKTAYGFFPSVINAKWVSSRY